MSSQDELYEAINNSNSHDLVKSIAQKMNGSTFHHHYHILYDIRTIMGPEKKVYTEIGTYCGGSSSLMMLHPFDTEINNIDPFCAIGGQKGTYEKNIAKFNVFDKKVSIHQVYSTNKIFVDQLKEKNFKTDILFIDGGHHYDDVINDFYKYHDFVNPGGYIIFDDYNDLKHSPDVKPAVDSICKYITDEGLPYEIIGVLDNVKQAKPTWKHQNELILKKN